MHQILLSRYFQEELQQRIWGRVLPPEDTIGSFSLTSVDLESCRCRYSVFTVVSPLDGMPPEGRDFTLCCCNLIIRYLHLAQGLVYVRHSNVS